MNEGRSIRTACVTLVVLASVCSQPLPLVAAEPANDAKTSGAVLRAPEKSWPMFRGNPHQTGVAGAPLPETLRIAWKHDLGEAILSTAAIVDGVVYVGVSDGFLHARSLETGKEIWKYAIVVMARPASGWRRTGRPFRRRRR